MFSSNTTQVSSGGYQISRSLRFNSADSAYLNRTPASAGNRRTWTWSAWVKRGKQGDFSYLFQGSAGNPTGGLDDGTAIRFSNNVSALTVYNLYNSSSTVEVSTSALFRDPSAWYHIIVAIDTTQATSTDRVKVYINGVFAPLNAGGVYPTLNEDLYVNTTNSHLIGALTRDGGGAQLFNDGLMTEINFIDGQALTPSSFGETNAQTGVWQPKAYSGSYGTNGFYLNFSDNSNTTAATLGKDYSGNGNNWTPNNFSVTAGANNDSLVDSPTSYGVDTGVGGTVRGNYATFNPLVKVDSQPTLSNGNLLSTAPAGWSSAVGTIGLTSGKWYWEIVNGNSDAFVGICGDNATLGTVAPQSSTATILYYGNTGNKRIDAVDTAYGSAFSTQTIGVALDIDGGTIVFYRDNVSQGSISLSSSTLNGRTIFPLSNVISTTATVNFGQRPFAYTAPSGFKALCTQNLPTPTIGATTATQAGKYFGVLTYTGNGSATQAITGLGFQPDFSWVKNRSNVAWYAVVDAVRTTAVQLDTTTTTDESNSINIKATYGGLSSFDSGGITVSSGSDGTYKVTNGSGQTYVAWNWKANGAGSTNTAGSITSTVSANTTSGFSVVTYTGNSTVGATVGHGLGVAPSMMFIKGRTNVDNWHVYSSALGNTGGLFLNLTNAFTVSSYFWNDTSPSSTVFTLSSGSSNNSSGVNYVAYCFAEVAGYSKFGSYTGNGSVDGPFVYTGFRPKYIMRKDATTGAGGTNWYIIDTSRAPYNASANVLAANQSYDEATFGSTNYAIDILSNGFRVKDSSGNVNASGNTYIYVAFADSPFKYSLAR